MEKKNHNKYGKEEETHSTIYTVTGIFREDDRKNGSESLCENTA